MVNYWLPDYGADFDLASLDRLTEEPRNEDRCYGQLWVALGANCLQINWDMTTCEKI